MFSFRSLLRKLSAFVGGHTVTPPPRFRPGLESFEDVRPPRETFSPQPADWH
jgi:hypothetical protein